MKRKKTTEYLIIAAAATVIGIALTVITAIALGGMSTPVRDIKDDDAAVVERLAAVTGDDTGVELAKTRIASGMFSVGDFAMSSFTSVEYLSLNKDDLVFAEELAVALEGSSDPTFINDILSDLRGHTRMYAINKAASSCDHSYSSTTHVPKEAGDSFENCVVTKPLEGTEGFTIGIRKVEGNFSATGDEA